MHYTLNTCEANLQNIDMGSREILSGLFHDFCRNEGYIMYFI